MSQFSKICADIKSVKIQGATNIAKAALRAYALNPTKKAKNTLLKLRLTEPALFNALNVAERSSVQKAMDHFDNAQQFINYYVHKIIQPSNVIMTHCHSSTVVKAFIATHKSGIKFSVINTETRPLYQGRITARQLVATGIPITMVVDSAMHEEILKSDMVIMGADAVTRRGVINKIGSGAIAELAHLHKKPLYIVTDSWKLSSDHVLIEKRSSKEVWQHHPQHITIDNPAFEIIPPKYISKIISELGICSYKEFLTEAAKTLKHAVSA